MYTKEERNTYARERTAMKRRMGQCFKCSNPIARGRSKTRCARCLDRINAKNATRNAQLLCLQCGEPQDGNGILCSLHRQQYRQLKRTQRQQRYEEGLCTNCGKPKGVNTYLKHCFACRKAASKSTAITPVVAI